MTSAEQIWEVSLMWWGEKMLSDLLKNGLWMPFFSDRENPDQERCLTGDVLRGCKCGSWSCSLMVQSSGTNNRTAIRMNERKAACMVNRSAGLLWSLLGSRNVPTVAMQLLPEEKVQRLYLNWGSVNWLTHGLIWITQWSLMQEEFLGLSLIKHSFWWRRHLSWLWTGMVREQNPQGWGIPGGLRGPGSTHLIHLLILLQIKPWGSFLGCSSEMFQ